MKIIRQPLRSASASIPQSKYFQGSFHWEFSELWEKILVGDFSAFFAICSHHVRGLHNSGRQYAEYTTVRDYSIGDNNITITSGKEVGLK